MTHTLRLDFLDHDGTLSPLVLEATKHGAVADRGLVNGSDTFDLTFKTKKQADAFRAKLSDAFSVETVDGDVDPEAEAEVHTDEPTAEPTAE